MQITVTLKEKKVNKSIKEDEQNEFKSVIFDNNDT